MKNIFNRRLSRKLALALVISGVPLVTMAAETTKPAKPTQPIANDELLAPNVAFKPEMRQRDAFTAELKFEVALGYYLYRDRIQVEQIMPATAAKKVAAKPQNKNQKAAANSNLKTNIVAVALSKPAGKPVDDPTFGKVDIYDASTTILVDLSRLDKKDPDLSLAVISQGCAAAGACYPPQKQVFKLRYLASTSTAGQWQRPINTGDDNQISFGQAGFSTALPTSAAPTSSPAPIRLLTTKPE